MHSLLIKTVRSLIFFALGILGILPVTNALALNVENIRFENILADHDVALGAMLTIVQDRQGFIWFGGIGGLVRYDGYTLHAVGDTGNANESIKSVHDIYEAGDTFWLATSYGLIALDKKTETYTRYTADENSALHLSQNYINKVIGLPNGELVVGSYGGFDVIDPARKTVQTLLPDKANDSSHFVFSLKVDAAKNRLWLGTSAGLYSYDWKKRVSRFFKTRSALDTTSVRAIDFGQDHSLWLGTDHGLFQVTQNGKVRHHFVANKDDPASLSANLIWSVLYDDGYVWAGTDQGGLCIYDEKHGRFTRLQSNIANPASLTTNTVKSLLRDQKGDIWVGNFPEGVHYFNKATTAATLFKNNPLAKTSLNHNSVMAFAADGKAGLWIGTDGGGLNYLDIPQQTFKQYTSEDREPYALRSNAVLALLNDHNGQLWTGTWGGGLAKYDAKNDRIERVTLRQAEDGSEEKFNVWSLYEDSQSVIWVGTQMKGLLRWNRAHEVTQYIPSEDPSTLAGEAVWSMLEDRQYQFWVGTNHGLNLMDRKTGKFIRYHHDSNDLRSISHNSVESMLEDSQGRLWFGTVGGLNLYHPDTNDFTRITRQQGLVSESIKSIVEDKQGNIWVGTTNGISQINRKTLAVRNFRPNIGWQKGSFNLGSAVATGEGLLYFGGPNGFMAFNPDDIEDLPSEVPVVFTELSIDAKIQKFASQFESLSTVLYAQAITIPHGAQMFSLSFAALDYSKPKNNQYRYRLKGFDKDWRDVGLSHTATYTNIMTGQYLFEVQASDNKGRWDNRVVTMPVTVK